MHIGPIGPESRCLVELFNKMFMTLADGVTIPETGCDVGAFITEAITKLGAVVAIAVGGMIAYFVIKKGIAWFRKI